ncbi:hypothetical protein K1T71_008519 [Dendrolimus kikuchii]|uniref:Uncharacterized protein n=1 Tax=Dendrolimus kikuchii TaxID=765133 RepID=A0ACC1CXZ2_9NEOP|nr:hypothetical protein K1T71_008519 [Dendrolimus kikuchii]
MEHTTPLLLLVVAAWAGCEPLQEAMHRRSESFGLYADKYAHNYEPYMYAAVPLHPPMPVLHILSPAPITSIKHDLRHSASVHQPVYQDRPRTSYGKAYQVYEEPYAKPSRPSYSYYDTLPTRPTHAISTINYNRYKDDFTQSYASSMPHMYVKPTYPTSVQYTYPTQEASAAILYASPNVDGGYTYKKRPTKKRTTPKTPPTPTESPVILRVHKYRVVKEYKR